MRTMKIAEKGSSIIIVGLATWTAMWWLPELQQFNSLIWLAILCNVLGGTMIIIEGIKALSKREYTGTRDNHGSKIYVGDTIQTYCYDQIQTHKVLRRNDGLYTAGGYGLDTIYFAGGGQHFKIIKRGK